MPRTIPAALALIACLAVASLSPALAAHIYIGPESFITSFDNATAIELEGATLKLVTAADVYGLSLANMAALHITLQPCTILQPHIHPHPEFAFTVKGEVTHSVVYNNMTLTDVKENTVTGVGNPGFAVFPAGQLHVTQNEGCSPAEVLAVFPVGAVDAYFFPYTEAYMPAKTVSSFFGGKVSNDDIWKPVGTAKLEGCSCAGGRRMAA